MRIAFIVLKTTGLPEGVKTYRDLSGYDSCRAVQITMHVYKGDKIHHERDYIVRPHGFVIAESEYHQVTQELAKSHGKSIKTVLKSVYGHLKHVDLIVSHNYFFYRNVLFSELYRAGMKHEIDKIKEIPYVCTMASSTGIVKLPRPDGKKGYKFPTLTELALFLFGKNAKKSHDAYHDIQLVVLCFFTMKARKMLK
jgi:hypothetical protein